MIGKKAYIGTALALLLAAAVGGCSFDSIEDFRPEQTEPCLADLEDTIKYSVHIDPIVKGICVECHSPPDNPPNKNYLIFSQFQAVAKSGVLVRAIKHEAGAQPMPRLKPQLNTCEIALIEKWVVQGAQEN